MIRGHVAKRDPGDGGDGVIARVQVDGTQLWQADIGARDTSGRDFSLNATVTVGTTVDFIVDPDTSDVDDSTILTAVLSVLSGEP